MSWRFIARSHCSVSKRASPTRRATPDGPPGRGQSCTADEEGPFYVEVPYQCTLWNPEGASGYLRRFATTREPRFPLGVAGPGNNLPERQWLGGRTHGPLGRLVIETPLLAFAAGEPTPACPWPWPFPVRRASAELASSQLRGDGRQLALANGDGRWGRQMPPHCPSSPYRMVSAFQVGSKAKLCLDRGTTRRSGRQCREWHHGRRRPRRGHPSRRHTRPAGAPARGGRSAAETGASLRIGEWHGSGHADAAPRGPTVRSCGHGSLMRCDTIEMATRSCLRGAGGCGSPRRDVVFF